MPATDTMNSREPRQASTQSLRAHRLTDARVAADAYRAQSGLESYIRQSGLDATLMDLVKLRASYMNGCAYCVDMHTKDARLHGETEQRLYAIPVWRETPFFTPRERAALAFAEAVTDISKGGVSDELFGLTREHFTEKEIIDLTMVVVTINGWNRISITFQSPVGSYVAGSSDARS